MATTWLNFKNKQHSLKDHVACIFENKQIYSPFNVSKHFKTHLNILLNLHKNGFLYYYNNHYNPKSTRASELEGGEVVYVGARIENFCWSQNYDQ